MERMGVPQFVSLSLLYHTVPIGVGVLKKMITEEDARKPANKINIML